MLIPKPKNKKGGTTLKKIWYYRHWNSCSCLCPCSCPFSCSFLCPCSCLCSCLYSCSCLCPCLCLCSCPCVSVFVSEFFCCRHAFVRSFNFFNCLFLIKPTRMFAKESRRLVILRAKDIAKLYNSLLWARNLFSPYFYLQSKLPLMVRVDNFVY